jgi:hypothetical protein
VQQSFNMPVISIATLDDLLDYLRVRGMARELQSVMRYRSQYGV